MPNKTLPVSIRLTPETKRALEAAAEADHRSLSSLMEKILSDWLEAQPKRKLGSRTR
jgi:predicted transcriptional regulator